MNYDNFHNRPKIQTKFIGQNNFTYRHTIQTLEKIPRLSKLKILDFGCGVGTVDFYLANKGCKITGTEISNKAIEFCRESAKTLGINDRCRFYRNDYKPNSKFDLIICSEVIEHVKNDGELLRKLSGFLKKGGYLFISTPSINAPLFKLNLLRTFDNRVGHLRRYDLESLVDKIVSLGLKVVETKKIEGLLRNSLFVFPRLGWIVKFLKGPISDLVTKIDDLLVKLFGESNLIILAQKV